MRDRRLLFLTRAARMFSYGFVSVILVLYLVELGFSETRIGLPFSCAPCPRSAVKSSSSMGS